MSLYPRFITEYLADLGIPRGPNSKIFLVDPADGDNNNSGDRWTKPVQTLAAAYTLTVANRNDVVLLLGNATGAELAAALEWAKSYTHLVGMGAPTAIAQRARISQAAALTGASPLLTVSASGCIFKNFSILQAVDDATSLICVSVTGNQNVFDNVHFAGGGHASNAIDGGASLKVDGGDENLFKHCTLGVDTIAAGTGLMCLLFDGAAARNVFEDCLFQLSVGNAGAIFGEMADTTAINFHTVFKRCLFLNTSSTAMTEAFALPAGVAAPRRIYLFDCAMHGATDWDSNDRGVLFQNNSTITVGGNAGLFLTTVAA